MAYGDVTQLLSRIRAGDAAAAENLLPIVYEEMRQLARARMARERAGHTLQATALVHEAFLRLTGGEEVGWDGRAHFFAAAAEAMRRVLVDHARRRAREKRGGGAVQVTLDEQAASVDAGDVDVLALSEALDGLEALDAGMAAVVKLRYFAGLSVEETAAALGASPRTVNRQWTAARAWLRRALADDARRLPEAGA
ncbi:MAG: ECF-type sigma factor [Pseudomonadota bacterium]